MEKNLQLVIMFENDYYRSGRIVLIYLQTKGKNVWLVSAFTTQRGSIIMSTFWIFKVYLGVTRLIKTKKYVC
jgi:hypothetical protein